MRARTIVLIIFFLTYYNLTAQYELTDKQEYLINELKDAYDGQIYYAYNYPKAYNVYKQLKNYSGMDYPIIFGQTFQWGQAHRGGLIILDYSTINKNRDILAFVFAHEWGHQALGHQPNIYNPYGSAWRVRSSPTQNEDEADVYAGGFLATYGYDINVVYNHLSGLPQDNNDHTHSSGKKRAKLVLQGYRNAGGGGYNDPVEYEYVYTACNHPAHPSGDIVNCNHQAHPRGDLYPCQHSCTNYYGQIVPCHPNGDAYACSHVAHPSGDVVSCMHALHPSGHTKKVRKY